MKVVINTCFGGFGLSALAVKKIAELEGRECYFYVHDDTDYKKYVQVPLEKAVDFFIAADIPDFHKLSEKERDKAWSKHVLDSGRETERHDPDLVAVVEELGAKASGSYAQLRVVEVPDGVEYIIEEYDGNEHIAEKHRTWS